MQTAASAAPTPATIDRPPARALQASLARPVPAALAALVALAAALRFYHLGNQGFWFDEGNTALLIHRPAGRMLGLIPHTESTPPLYYCVAWLWARLFGLHEAGLRSLSALCGLTTVPVAFAASRELLRSDRAALVVAALTACNPLLIWYSQEARSYALLVLLSSLALLACIHAVRSPSRNALTAWVIASALALATHYYAVVALVPEAVWLLYEHRRRRAVQLALGAVGLVGLALVPLAIVQNHTGHDSWIGHSPLGVRLAQILPQVLIGPSVPMPIRAPLKFAAFALALAALALLRASPRRAAERRPALIAAGIALGGFLLSLAFVAAGSDSLLTRNLIALWLPAALLLAGGLAGPGAGRVIRPLGVTLTAGLCAIGIGVAIAVATDYDLQRPDWRPLAALIDASHPPSRAILIQHYRTLLPLSLYLPRLHFLTGARATIQVGELDVIAMSSPQQPLCWWGAACNLIPSRLQRSYPIPGFRELWVRRVHRFTIMRLVPDRPGGDSRATAPLNARMLARALRTTTLPRDELLIQRPGAG